MNIRILGKMDKKETSVKARKRRGISIRVRRKGRARRRGGGISRKLKGNHSLHFQFIL